jgi:hypothetical protein
MLFGLNQILLFNKAKTVIFDLIKITLFINNKTATFNLIETPLLNKIKIVTLRLYYNKVSLMLSSCNSHLFNGCHGWN